MNEIGIKRVGNSIGTVLEIVLNRGTRASRSADKSALEKSGAWPREGFCPGGRIPKPGLSYGFIPAILVRLR